MSKYFPVNFCAGIAIAALLAGSGCHPAYRATATKTEVQKLLCGEEWLSFPEQPHPIFEALPGPVKDAPADIPLPSQYQRYQVNEDTLNAFIAYFRAGKKGGIILPIEQHCEPFSLRRSGAMGPELQIRYPQLVSLQGSGVNNKAADIRLDWNGRQLRGQITFNGSVYFIMPVRENNATTYLIYNRNDAGEQKQPFEQKPATNTQKILYDR